MSATDAPLCFVDTNVFVYALSADDEKRSLVAQKLLRELMTSQALRTSTQVLQELFVEVLDEIGVSTVQSRGGELIGK